MRVFNEISHKGTKTRRNLATEFTERTEDLLQLSSLLPAEQLKFKFLTSLANKLSTRFQNLHFC